jgi:hypothetical protein
MKWVVLSILVFAVFYTFVNIRYRKPGPGYLPYEDSRVKAGLLKAGYQRISVKIDRPADPPPVVGGADVEASDPGLPADLRAAFVKQPLLPAQIESVAAPGSADGSRPYPIRFRFDQGDNRRQFSDAKLYVKGEEVYVVPECEVLDDPLQTRTRISVILLTVPPGAFPAGRYHFTLFGERGAMGWSVQVH